MKGKEGSKGGERVVSLCTSYLSRPFSRMREGRERRRGEGMTHWSHAYSLSNQPLPPPSSLSPTNHFFACQSNRIPILGPPSSLSLHCPLHFLFTPFYRLLLILPFTLLPSPPFLFPLLQLHHNNCHSIIHTRGGRGELPPPSSLSREER